MIRISKVRPLEGRVVQLTLTDGSVVERDLGGLLDGAGVFERITVDDAAFRLVYVDGGTLAWPGELGGPASIEMLATRLGMSERGKEVACERHGSLWS